MLAKNHENAKKNDAYAGENPRKCEEKMNMLAKNHKNVMKKKKPMNTLVKNQQNVKKKNP